MKRKELKASVMVESIWILVVLIALVVLFKSELNNLVGDIFAKITIQALGI